MKAFHRRSESFSYCDKADHALSGGPCCANTSSPSSGSVPFIKRPSSSRSSSGLLGHDSMLIRRRDSIESLKRDLENLGEPHIPTNLQWGTRVFRVTKRKTKMRTLSIDASTGSILIDFRKRKFSIDEIREIRNAQRARNYREQFNIPIEVEDRWITVIFFSEGKIKVFHMIAPSLGLARAWYETLEKLCSHRQVLMESATAIVPADDVLHAQWSRSGYSDTEQITYSNVEYLCRKLQVSAPAKVIEAKFGALASGLEKSIGFPEFQKLVKELKVRPDVRKILDAYSRNGHLSFESFRRFVHNVQKDVDCSDAKLQEIFAHFAGPHSDYITYEGFAKFLSSDHNALLKSTENDLSRPLNEYFISSSHNTYLLGGQLRGESSIEGYIDALQRGCRSVEIDCWDGADSPVVCHGRTFTTKISFEDVVKAIHTHAFSASSLPLIISLEIHCSIDQQNQMAHILKSTFGGALVTHQLNDTAQLPSPLDAQLRVILKIKCPVLEATSEVDSALESLSFDSSSFESPSDNIAGYASEMTALTQPRSGKHRRQRFQLSPALHALAVYCKTIHFNNFSLPESKTTDHMFSFSERTLNQLKRSVNEQLEKHNVRFLMRVYPSAYRILSSNFDPVPYWSLGIQMVALNWQTHDLSMQLNDAMFASNQACGYCLKPPSLRSRIKEKPESQASPLALSITVISGQHLPRPRDLPQNVSVRPCVNIEIFQSGQPSKQWSSAVGLNTKAGFFWEETCQLTYTPSTNQLDFIRFQVLHDNSVIASFTARLSLLSSGFRHVPLKDLQGDDYLFSTIFTHIMMDDTSA